MWFPQVNRLLPPICASLCLYWGPLIDLFKSASFTRNPQALEAFAALQSAIISLPVLGLPNFSLPFDETTDASYIAVGAVLSQLHHPIAFFSKKLCLRMQSFSTYDRETFAITEAVRKWRHYLLSRKFCIFTEQHSLRSLLTQTIETPV
ncbi:UNVERIFIED_CONTAM: Retrovirus-related Pol polyprotein from transposon [Sesamum radiatum]|uniref:Retrovirus-related Pol polyprotein from transposon n=1 Tax=Sesamum radiatum TaxID=300843 RepID=A0AAW2L999_SESRA